MARVSSSIALWTHYYDPDAIRGSADLAKKFADEPLVRTFGGREIVSYRQSYPETLNWGGFSGGSAPTSYWLTPDSLLGMLEALGYAVQVGADEKDHPNGPCMTLFA